MNKSSLLAVAGSMLVLGLLLSQVTNVRAAEMQILAGGAMTAPLRELAAQFERASGHKLVFRFGTTPELIKLVTAGGPFDLAVVPVDVVKDAAARAQLAPGPTIDIARVGLGVAVRSGAPKPDVSTPDAEASISQSAEGPIVGRSAIVHSPLRSKYTHAPMSAASLMIA